MRTSRSPFFLLDLNAKRALAFTAAEPPLSPGVEREERRVEQEAVHRGPSIPGCPFINFSCTYHITSSTSQRQDRLWGSDHFHPGCISALRWFRTPVSSNHSKKLPEQLICHFWGVVPCPPHNTTPPTPPPLFLFLSLATKGYYAVLWNQWALQAIVQTRGKAAQDPQYAALFLNFL